MRRWIVIAVVLGVAVLGIGELGDLTQSRPDAVNDDAETHLVVDVAIDRFRGGVDAAVGALWSVCAAQTSAQVIDDHGPRSLGNGRYEVVLHPAVGHHEQRKLVGCLEDLTIDRVVGDVVSFRTVTLSDGAAR